jgi:predicted permease
MFQILSGQTIIMFLMILIGYVIFKTHLADHEGNKTVSNILLLVVTPAMLMDTLFSMKYSVRILQGLMVAIALGFVSHFAVIAITGLFLRKKNNDPEIGMERYLAVYSNCGFMGIPLVSSVYGAEAVLYMTGYMIAFNVLTWTHGLIEITGKTSFEKVWKGLLSPTVVCTVIGIVVFVFQIPIEAHVLRAISYIGAMNTPMGMIVAGIVLAETGLGGIWKKPRIFLVTALKLFVAPAVTFLLLILARKVIGISDELFYAILIPAACPAATTGTMMALRYDKDFEFSSQVFVVSTLLSMLTIPLLISAARVIAG